MSQKEIKIKDPSGLATPRQLYALNARGLLGIRQQSDQSRAITKGLAGEWIDKTDQNGAVVKP